MEVVARIAVRPIHHTTGGGPHLQGVVPGVDHEIDIHGETNDAEAIRQREGDQDQGIGKGTDGAADRGDGIMDKRHCVVSLCTEFHSVCCTEKSLCSQTRTMMKLSLVHFVEEQKEIEIQIERT